MEIPQVEDAQIIQQAPITSTPLWLKRLTLLSMLGLLLALPICFGGIHPQTWLIAHTLCFILLSLYLLFAPDALKLGFSKGTVALFTLSGFIAFFIYLCAQTAFLILSQKSHPVLGLTSLHPAPAAAINALSEILFFICAFVLTRVWLCQSERNTSRLFAALMACGLIVSLIALAHWFYDNGKLFWIFAPDSVFISARARWPFVNPNHLAHFLLPICFLLCGSIAINILSISKYATQELLLRKQPLSKFFLSRRIQMRFVKLFFSLVFLLSALLCIFGSLSRASWLGLAIGIFTFAFLHWRLKKSAAWQNEAAGNSQNHTNKSPDTAHYTALEKEVVDVTDSPTAELFRRSSKRRRRSHASEQALPLSTRLAGIIVRLSKPVLLIMAAFVFFLFLHGRGQELFNERLEYGLSYSKDDIRFKLYSDTLPMINDYNWLGVGLNAWGKIYPRYMDPAIAGVDPIYLHSDPLQLLVEGGLPAALLLLLLALYLSQKALRCALYKAAPQQALQIVSLFCGFIALTTAALLDFPFHIPAIVFYAAVYLALIIRLIDSTQKEEA